MIIFSRSNWLDSCFCA